MSILDRDRWEARGITHRLQVQIDHEGKGWLVIASSFSGSATCTLSREEAAELVLFLGADDLDALRAENARLREAVEAAPHDRGCGFGWSKVRPDLRPGEPLPCTCWKAETLKIGETE